jgi:hypothetical protein
VDETLSPDGAMKTTFAGIDIVNRTSLYERSGS